MITFQEFLNEKYSETLNLPKNKWQNIDPKKHKELQDEFFDLITVAYAEIGGNANINKPEDVFSDSGMTFWQVADIDDIPDADLVMFGKNTKYGVKFAGIGHDGSREAKKFYVATRAKELTNRGYYMEASKKLADILIAKYKVPIVNDEESIRKVLGKDIEWHGTHPYDKNKPGDGWYIRKIGNSFYPKILLGRPKV